MDHLLYWLDGGNWLVPLRHAWIWASLTGMLAIMTVFGIAALARHYDADERRDVESESGGQHPLQT
jgi:hypothetical protein